MANNNNGIIQIGEHCNAQGYYFDCTIYGGMCPYIENGVNKQNDCPHNQLKK